MVLEGRRRVREACGGEAKPGRQTVKPGHDAQQAEGIPALQRQLKKENRQRRRRKKGERKTDKRQKGMKDTKGNRRKRKHIV